MGAYNSSDEEEFFEVPTMMEVDTQVFTKRFKIKVTNLA